MQRPEMSQPSPGQLAFRGVVRAAGPHLPVIGYSLLTALLASTEYLFQPFVWRHWPLDEVLLGWLDVLRDRIAIATPVALALIASSAVATRSLRARAIVMTLAIVGGAALGELALLSAGVVGGAMQETSAVLGRIARWGIVATCAAAMWFVWQRALAAGKDVRAQELRRVQLERQATETQLDALRRQIDPHFLFNTLATARRLHQIDPARGRRLLAHFIDYLRSAVPAGHGARYTLGQELDLVRAYLGVIELRMAGRLEVHIDVPDELRSRPFPPLTIATLVENAVKHGIEPSPTGGVISVSARRTPGNAVETEVIDTGVGFSGASGSGIGLANIRARLAVLYGGAGTLSLRANTPSGVRASLRMPLTEPFA